MNFKSAWKVLLSLMLVFILTFIIFPGVFFDTHLVLMKNIGKNEFTWYSLYVITVFNVMDTVGRKMGGMLNISFECVALMSILRSIFVVVAIWIVVLGDGSTSFLASDTVQIVNLVLFAFSNGFVSTLCAIKAPAFVAED